MQSEPQEDDHDENGQHKAVRMADLAKPPEMHRIFSDRTHQSAAFKFATTVRPPPSGHLERGIIHPQAAWYRGWSYFIALLAIFSCFYTPLELVVSAGDEQGFGAVFLETLLTCIFACDILITFNVAFFSPKGLITERRAIFVRTVRSFGFCTDLLATIPFATIMDLIDDTVCRPGSFTCSALRLLRLLRAHRILLTFRELQKSTHLNLLGVVVAKFFLLILMMTHTAGCIFYRVARTRSFDGDTWVRAVDPELPEHTWTTRYAHALYWAIGTFKAGPASGDHRPRSIAEMVVACTAMVLNICVQAYLVSSMSALLTTADLTIYALRNKLRQLAQFSDRHRLPVELHEHLRSYLWFKFHSNEDLDQNVLEGLPEMYRQQVSHALYEDIVSRVSLFKGCQRPFLLYLHSILKSTFYMPGQELVNVGEQPTHMQIIAEGEVQVCLDEAVIHVCRVGKILPATPFICNIGQPFSMRAGQLCRVLGITRFAWDTAASAHPTDVAQVTTNLVAEAKRFAMKLDTKEGRDIYAKLVESLQSYLQREREMAVSTLCFAAVRGDIAEMKRILVGHTAKCADYDRRTPLHIAAANGQVEALRLLVERLADVNAVDNFGRTPLLEACRSRQNAAAEYLYDQGSSLGFNPRLQLAEQLPLDIGFVDTAPGKALDQRSSVTRSMSIISSRGTSDDFRAIQSRHVEASELCQAASDPEQLWYLASLLRYSSDVNASDYDARTALHVACAAGNKPAVELLLKSEELEYDSVDNFGRTALMEAVRHGHEPCARLLKQVGAHHGFCENPKLSTSANVVHAGQELCQAAFGNQTVYLRSLTEYCGLNIDAADYDYRTALMLACAEGNSDVAITLVQHGADVTKKDRWGHTPLSEARAAGHPDLALVLEQLTKKSKTHRTTGFAGVAVP